MEKLEKIGMKFINLYNRQKFHANRRNIPFLVSFEEWLNWWGEDIHQRGRGMGKLQMCRNKDCGPYSLENIFKSSHEQNMRDKKINGTHRARPKKANEDKIEEVFKSLAQGLSTRKVAKLVGISQRTVVHIKNATGCYSFLKEQNG
jgi:Helix-turn-helix domain of resolvase